MEQHIKFMKNCCGLASGTRKQQEIRHLLNNATGALIRIKNGGEVGRVVWDNGRPRAVLVPICPAEELQYIAGLAEQAAAIFDAAA